MTYFKKIKNKILIKKINYLDFNKINYKRMALNLQLSKKSSIN